MNEKNNDRKETIIVYAVVIVTLIIAVWIGTKLNIRIKTMFWGLVIIEMLIYSAANAVMEKLRGRKGKPDYVPVNDAKPVSVNPMYNTYKQIIEYCEKIEDLGINTYKMYPATTQEKIDEWEYRNSAKLPEGYKNWLLLSNGFEFSSTEIYSIERICEYDYSDHEGCFIIGLYIGDGSMLLTDREGNFYEHDHGFHKETRMLFEDFLQEWVIPQLKEEI